MKTWPANSTLLTINQCRRCGAQILTGLDDPRHALTATLDPILYTRDQTIGLILLGRYAYHVQKTFGQRWAITSARYWNRTLPTTEWDHKTDYMASHVCGQPIPGGHKIRLPSLQGGDDLFTTANQPEDPFAGQPPF